MLWMTSLTPVFPTIFHQEFFYILVLSFILLNTETFAFSNCLLVWYLAVGGEDILCVLWVFWQTVARVLIEFAAGF